MLGRPAGRSLLRTLAYFGLTRLTLFVVAASAIRFVHPVEQVFKPELRHQLSLLAWVRWDAWWYLSVVERGYWFDPQGQSNVAFFPLFPLLIRGLTGVLGNPVVAGVFLANLAALGAVIALWAWMRAAGGLEAAEGAVRWLLVYPFAFFLHALYAESLYCLLVTLALGAAHRRRWPWAGVWGGLAAATRPMGVLLFPALVWGLCQEARRGGAPRLRDVVSLGLVPMGLALYGAYLWAAFGDPFVVWGAHAVGWHVRWAGDLDRYTHEAMGVLRHGLRFNGYTQLLRTLRLLLPPLFVGLTIQAFRYLGAVAGLYTGLSVAVGTLFAFESVGREYLAAVPALAVLGLMGGREGEALRLLAFGLLGLLLFVFVTGLVFVG